MKLVVTGTRGIPDIMGGVETHCEELFPRIAAKGVDTTLIRRKDYVRFSHRVEGGEAGGYQRTEKEIIRSGCPYVSGCKQGEKAGSGRGAYSCHRTCAVSAICKDARHEGGVHASRARL